MSQQVAANAMLKCSFGTAPSVFLVLPTNRVLVEGQPAANIMDFAPGVNIFPFGMCTTPTNPAVASATTAAGGVLTPVPCFPVTTAPWSPGAPNALIANQPALNNTAVCMCNYGGAITINYAGSNLTEIP